MKNRLAFRIGMALAFVGAGIPVAAQTRATTTAGAIATANLDHGLAQSADPEQRIDRLLAQSRFLANDGALEEAATLAESLPASAGNLLLRARTRAATHRFGDAIADLDQARRSGADAQRIAALRATISIATGRAAEALAHLESEADARPGYAAHSALASAYAELGRYAEADRRYRLALDDLRTTSPFPYAWVHFARGLMWSEQAGDTERGEALYAQALAYLPEFATATVHKAELEFARGDLTSAADRLAPVAEATREPEAIALLGEIRQRAGDATGANRDIALAAQRYESLLRRHPLAFADHAAAFYLGPGANPERAWHWARLNLSNRATPRAFVLAIRAAAASGRDACELVRQMMSALDDASLPAAARAAWERRAADSVAGRCS